jgi:hypothetical protein
VAPLHLSRFEPEPGPERNAEWLACLWQGPVPEGLVLHRWLYYEGEPRAMALLWEGDADAAAWVARAFGSFGRLETSVVTDATPGLAACLDRDLDAFRAWMRGRGSPDAEIERALDVRRRGRDASTQEEAVAGARAWVTEGP